MEFIVSVAAIALALGGRLKSRHLSQLGKVREAIVPNSVMI
jgi:hypothetical protein